MNLFCKISQFISFFIVLLMTTTDALASGPVIPADSLFAVITHKGGFAKGLAHNHFVHAGNWKVESSGEDLDSLQLKLRFPSAELVMDHSETVNRFFARVKQLGILSEAFSQVPDKDRAKIRTAMLGKSQLNADAFPQIMARLVKVEHKPTNFGSVSFPQLLHVAVTLVGKEVLTTFPGALSIAEGKLMLEAVGTLKFSEFGIKPYSALFGAVSNQDQFHVLISTKPQ